MNSIICNLCPHHCALREGETGRCHGRKNEKGTNKCANYGMVSSIALDPIEKKPLNMFFSGSRILSVGSCGCNMSCPFCQNSSISMRSCGSDCVYIPPDELAEKAFELGESGNIGVAFTYNEPLIGYEYMLDCAALLHSRGMKAVAVTNGCFTDVVADAVLPHIDAYNIDLKGFTEKFYKMAGGDLETVKAFIARAAEAAHVELTTLIIPGLNDTPDEMERLSGWIASVSPDIPLHISRFFPRYNMTDRPPTDVELIYSLKNTAGKRLKYVYTGNC